MVDSSETKQNKISRRKVGFNVCCAGCGTSMQSTVDHVIQKRAGKKRYCVDCRQFGMVSLNSYLERIK